MIAKEELTCDCDARIRRAQYLFSPVNVSASVQHFESPAILNERPTALLNAA